MIKNSKPTFLKGTVIHGRKIGRTIGFPTANIHVVQEPKHFLKGVYGVEIYHKGSLYYGVMNIGVRPTFKDIKQSISCEVHIFDFAEDIYGDYLSVDVVFFIRDEVAFKSKYQLIQQLNHDVKNAKKIFLKRKGFSKRCVKENL